jgi:hypothetical protein
VSRRRKTVTLIETAAEILREHHPQKYRGPRVSLTPRDVSALGEICISVEEGKNCAIRPIKRFRRLVTNLVSGFSRPVILNHLWPGMGFLPIFPSSSNC